MKTSQIIGDFPITILKIGFQKYRVKYGEHYPHCAKCGTFHPVFWWGNFLLMQFMHIFEWSIWKSMETARVWKTLSPYDWMRELVFWEELILENLSNNFIKITFCDGFFFFFTAWWARGHYCWVAGCFTLINMAFHWKLNHLKFEWIYFWSKTCDRIT